jgi:hypothetical protein
VVSTGTLLPAWRFGFKQSSFTHIMRVLQHLCLHVFIRSLRSRQALVPFCVSTSGQPVTQKPSSQFFLVLPGISSCATRRTLAQGGVSRILTYSTSLARCRCPFASLNGIISHRFPQRAFHWSHQPQCISHPCSTGVYCRNVATGAIYNDGRGFRRWKARFGNAASP